MSRHGLEIRAATAADAPGLAALLAVGGRGPDARALAERLSAMRDAAGATLLALQWGPPCGVIALHWHPTLEEDRPAAIVTTLLVGPDDRRLGIGRLLLKAAAQAARAAGCARMALLAPADAPHLAEFCRATGFAGEGEVFLRSLRRQG
jgi:GNAT superfamily N-acetyltransferase